MAKTYTKISETKFRWSEERHHEGEIDAIEYLQHLADQLNTMRKLVANANTIQDQFLQIVEYYNQSREVLREAKEKLHLAVTVPEEIKLPECFSVIEVVPENLPKVSIARDEEKVEN